VVDDVFENRALEPAATSKEIRRTWSKHDVATPPWRIADQAPLVAASGIVRRHQHIARV